MKAKDYIGLKFKEADEKFGSKHLEEAMEEYELNTCDKCTEIDRSMDLVWITEDFNPRQDENVSREFYEYWADSALCERCYLQEL